MQLQLRSYVRLPDKHGRKKLHYPDAIVTVRNKKLAQELISSGRAIDIRDIARKLPSDAGIIMRGRGPDPEWAKGLGLEILRGEPQLAFEYTLIWNPAVTPRWSRIPPTLKALRAFPFNVAAPVYSYDRLCCHIGNKEDRALTEAVIREMRIPAYNVSLLFVQRDEQTEMLFNRWRAEKQRGDNERLAFMRALYVVKPLLLPLPMEWVVRSR